MLRGNLGLYYPHEDATISVIRNALAAAAEADDEE